MELQGMAGKLGVVIAQNKTSLEILGPIKETEKRGEKPSKL